MSSLLGFWSHSVYSWLLNEGLRVKLGVSALASFLESKMLSLLNSLPSELSYSIAGLQGPNVLLAARV